MQGSIAQVAALTIYGNKFLAQPSTFDMTGFFPVNSTFAFCEWVKFADLGVGGRAELYADEPVAWFFRLKHDKTASLRMAYTSSGRSELERQQIADRQLVGFAGGGGRWVIEAVGPGGSDYWEARWDVGDQERKDRKIWRVTYVRVSARQYRGARQTIDLTELKSQLAANLEAIGAFAREHNLDGFAESFERALFRLNAADPLKGDDHADLASGCRLELPAVQLLGAAQAAWVFGGMGSWNDLAFEGEEKVLYDRLSEQLYHLLNTAVVAAANSNEPPDIAPNPEPWWKMKVW